MPSLGVQTKLTPTNHFCLVILDMVTFTNDVRFHISSLQAFLFIYPLFNLVDYACENKIIMGSRCLDSNLLNNILVSIIIHD